MKATAVNFGIENIEVISKKGMATSAKTLCAGVRARGCVYTISTMTKKTVGQ